MVYIEGLKSRCKTIQNVIELLCTKYKVQPVGNGYIDMIIENEFVDGFIEELTKSGFVVEGVSWWCHCTQDSQVKLGCPHGLGGPKSEFFEGWFSETDIPMFEISSYDLSEINKISTYEKIKFINDKIVNSIKEFRKSDNYMECLVPALWILVPEEWER
jgi:hypothetical protein